MGMGEPFANYDRWWQSVERLHDPRGFNLGARGLTVSTVGLAPGIRRLAGESLPINLAISLHSPDDALRSEMMPINRRYPIAALLDATRDYIAQTHRRVSFEYVLLQGKNDRPEQAIASFETARKMNPMSSNALVQIGVIQLDDFKNERAALEKFNEAIVLDPGNGLAYANRANILSRYARSKSEAIRDFRKALEIDRDDDYAKNGLRKLGIAP